jgi:hypothetical protein
MYEQHWRYMKRIIELGDGPKVYARYNTNLSRIQFKGDNLYTDILAHLRDWQICASLDGTGKTGEYIRTGLRYDQWLENFRGSEGLRRDRRQVRIDFTLTLPGLTECRNILELARSEGVDVLAKVVFSFGPDIMMSPLAMPRAILHPWVDEILADCPPGEMHDILVQLKNRPTFDEQWPDSYKLAQQAGTRRILQLERIRDDKYTMSDILKQREEAYEWWESIEVR